MFKLVSNTGETVFQTASFNLFVETLNQELVWPNWTRFSSSVLRSTQLGQYSTWNDVMNVVTFLGFRAYFEEGENY